MNNDNFDQDIWTEAEYAPECYCPFVKEAIFDEDLTTFYLCRKDEERKKVRMSSIVFRLKGEEDWEDDLMEGCIEVQALGSGKEEPQPVEVYNIGVNPQDFVKVVDQKGDKLTIAVDYPMGNVEIENAEKCEAGFRISRQQLLESGEFAMTLTPEEGEAFTMHLTIPYLGMVIRDEEGNVVSGDLEIPFEKILGYTYSFKGNVDDDRFTISFNNDKKIYHYILTDDGKLSIRSRKDHMDKVGEIEAEGRLALLLQGIPNAIIKHKEQRWRIIVTE